MAITNGSKTVAWIAVLIAGMGATATTTFVLTKAAIDNTNEQLLEIKTEMKNFTSELNFRVEKANEIHAQFNTRLTIVEQQVEKL